jgi:uncharacterized iron-regulated membrane protein
VVDISRPWGTELPRTKNPQTFIRFNALTGERLPSPYSEGPGRTMLLALVALHEAWYANDPLRWLYFLSGLLGCFMIATGMVLWVVTYLGFLAYVPVVLWVFHTRSAVHAWGWLLLWTALATLACWALLQGGAA